MDLRLLQFDNANDIGCELYKVLKIIIEKNIGIMFNLENINEYYTLLCVTEDDIIAGVGIVKNESILEYLCVKESYRKKGIGKRIVNKLLDKYSFLQVLPAKDVSFDFYFKNYDFSYSINEKYFIIKRL